MNRIGSYFSVAEKGSSLRIEFLAGVSTFLSLSYILVVNPAILSQGGMNKASVFFATVVISGLATVLMGVWARLPFVLAPGMEMNAYVAYFAIGALGLTWQQALGTVFWSGVLFVILTVTRVREQIINAIPERMKAGLSLSVGVFLALVALRIAGVLRYEQVHIRGFGSFTSIAALSLYLSLFVVLVLDRLNVRAGVLISITLASLFCHWGGIRLSTEGFAGISRDMLSGIGRLDLGVVLVPKSLSVILVLFLIDFYGSVAKLIGLSTNTSITEKGVLPHLKRALLVDSIGTTLGSVLGTSSITVYVESGVGIATGGRTGLSAVVCGLFLFVSFLAAPILKYVPLEATTGALVFVTIKLLPSYFELGQYDWWDFVGIGLMLVAVIISFALDRAMLAGLSVYLVRDVVQGRRVNPYLVGSALLLAIGVALQVLS